MSDGYTDAVIKEYQREIEYASDTIRKQTIELEELRKTVYTLTKQLASCRKYWERND